MSEMDLLNCCDICGEGHNTEQCPELNLGGDASVQLDQLSTRARLTLPHYLEVVDNGSGLVGVVAKETVQKKTQLGPYEAKRTTHIFDDVGFFTLKLIATDGTTVCLDTTDENECNWLCLVRAALSNEDQNCMAYQLGSNIFYNTTRDIQPGEELLVWYAPHFARKLGKPSTPDSLTRVLLGHRIEPLTNDMVIEDGTSCRSMDDVDEEQIGDDGQDVMPEASAVGGVALPQGEIKKAFYCPRCGNTFASQSEMVMHLRGHINDIVIESKKGQRGPGRPRKNLVRPKSETPKRSRGRPKKKQPIFAGVYPNGPEDIKLSRTWRTYNKKRKRELVSGEDDDDVRNNADNDNGDDDDDFRDQLMADIDDYFPKKEVEVTIRRSQPRRSTRGKHSKFDSDYIYQIDKLTDSTKKSQLKLKNKSKNNDTDVTQTESAEGSKSFLKVKVGVNPVAYMYEPHKKKSLRTPAESIKIFDATDKNLADEKERLTANMVKDSLAALKGKNAVIVVEINELKNYDQGAGEPSTDTDERPVTDEEHTNNGDKHLIANDKCPFSAFKHPITDKEPVTVDKHPVTETEPVTADKHPSTETEPFAANKHPIIDEEPVLADKHPSTETDPVTAYKHPIIDEEPVTIDKHPSTEKNPVTADKLPITDKMAVLADKHPSNADKSLITNEQPSEGENKVTESMNNADIKVGHIIEDMKARNDQIQDIGVEKETDIHELEETVANKQDLEGKVATNGDKERKNELSEEYSVNVAQIEEQAKNEAEIENNEIADSTDVLQDIPSAVEHINNESSINTDKKEGATIEIKDRINDFEDIYINLDDRELEIDESSIQIGHQQDSVTMATSVTMVTEESNSDKDSKMDQVNASSDERGNLEDSKSNIIETSESDDEDNDDDENTDVKEGNSIETRSLDEEESSGNEIKHVKENIAEKITKKENSENGSSEKIVTIPCSEISVVHDKKTIQMEDKGSLVIMFEETDDGKYGCVLCNETFTEEINAISHFMDHNQNDNGICKSCYAEFKSFNELLLHRKTCAAAKRGTEESSEVNNFECDICHQAFKTAQYLYRHMVMHTDVFTCLKCKKTFSRKDSLQKHVLKCCPELAEHYAMYYCNICHRVFSKEAGLQRHTIKCQSVKCDVCLKIFATQDELVKHKCQTHETEETARYACGQCSKCFQSMYYLNQHRQMHSNLFVCPRCGRTLASKEELDSHRLLCETLESIRMYGSGSCSLCDLNFTNTKQFREHALSHTHPYHCTQCDKRFMKVGSWKSHECSKAMVNYTCSVCQRSFRNESSLEKHTNGRECMQYICTGCDEMFHLKSQARDHLANCAGDTDVEKTIIKKNNMEEVCQTCGKSFSSRSNLTKHMMLHGEKRFACPHCEKKFHLDIYLKEHITCVHYNIFKYQCNSCGRMMKSKTGLVAHIKIFHSKDAETFPCSECNKVFKQKGNLKAHMFSHTSERQFVCDACPRAFKFPDQLSRHKREHNVQYKLNCPHCQKQFVRGYDLKRHLQVDHSGCVFVCDLCSARCCQRHTLIRHFRRKHPDQMQLLTKKGYVQAMWKHISTLGDSSSPSKISEIVSAEQVEMLPQDAAEALQRLGMGNATNKQYQLLKDKGLLTEMTGGQPVTIVGDENNIIVPQDSYIIQNQDLQGHLVADTDQDGNIITEGPDSGIGLVRNEDGTISINNVHGLPHTIQELEGADGQIVILQIVDPENQEQAVEMFTDISGLTHGVQVLDESHSEMHIQQGDIIQQVQQTGIIQQGDIIQQENIVSQGEFIPQGHLVQQGNIIHQGSILQHSQEGGIIQQGNIIHQGDIIQGDITQEDELLGDPEDQLVEQAGEVIQHMGTVIDNSGQIIQHQGQTIQNSEEIIQHTGEVIQHHSGEVISTTGEFIQEENEVVEGEVIQQYEDLIMDRQMGAVLISKDLTNQEHLI